MTSLRKNKIAMIVAIIVLFAVAVSAMGVSYAVWISPDGPIGGGSSKASPSVTPDSNNVWAKYFNYKEITVEGLQGKYVEISTFYTDGENAQGLNLSDLYIPEVIWVEKGSRKVLATLDGVSENAYETYNVYRITNSIFADSSLKSLPVTIHIPASVCEIDDAAFAGLPNLQAVYFENRNPCTIGAYAFAGCSNLEYVYNVRGVGVTPDVTSFVGTKITVTDGQIRFAKK